MRVLLEVRSEAGTGPTLAATAETSEPPFDIGAIAAAGLRVDESFPAVVVPRPRAKVRGGLLLAMGHRPEFSFEPEEVSYLVRGTVPDDDGGQAMVNELLSNPQVKGVFSDPAIATTLTCVGDEPVGDASTVGAKLDVDALTDAGLDGSGVRLAVVDTGINLEFLEAKGISGLLDTADSFTPTGVATTPGKHPVHHGTMCAFDTRIAAPNAELLDHAVLLSQAQGQTVMEGLLSDAVRSFSQLRALISEGDRPLVVSCSWGVFDPGWDFPVGHPGNYTDNPAHPFNLIVSSLESAGADILFAAGNCGVECPDGRCKLPSHPICGANSHPSVLSVGGIDTNDERVGYSSQGPGRLSAAKPDLCAYTHFLGSEAFGSGEPDSGTSAACPVAAGVVAAVRGKYSPSQLSPLQLRALLERTSVDLSEVGFNYDYGWGALSPQGLLPALP
jgi:subtilisin family serine protease